MEWLNFGSVEETVVGKNPLCAFLISRSKITVSPPETKFNVGFFFASLVMLIDDYILEIGLRTGKTYRLEKRVLTS